MMLPRSFERAAIGLLLIGICGAAHAQTGRPRVGVAFGGGSARGIAHIGVIRWFEEHRVPIDLAAGTSMGGLVGGGFAAGMSADELQHLIETTDWDMMFGSSSFPFKNVRRKLDARLYPSRLEFGLKRGIVLPTSLNNGQQVDFLLARIAAAYYGIDHFDELPTPFRTVAVDLRTAQRVVLDSGSLAQAMRATMSLPGVFPPVEVDGQVLVDGGALDNIPADVVRDMGADVVIAVDVGYLPEEEVELSLFGLMSRTVDAMMRANTARALQAADTIIAVDVQEFGSLDWRRADALIQRGYEAAERHRDDLLRLAVGEADWQAWVAARAGRRRQTIPAPQSISTAGIVQADAALVRRTLARHLDRELNLPELETDLATLSGLDRYQTIGWQIIGTPGREGLLLHASEKPYAPPFLMLGLNLENTTSDSFRVQLAGRYLAFDTLGSGSELRVDATIGSDPSAGISLYRPIRRSRVFVRPFGVAETSTLNLIEDDLVIAEYRETRLYAGAEIGVNLSRLTELAGGIRAGRLDATVRAGDPDLPELSGGEALLRLRFIHDGHDSPVVPSSRTRALVTFVHYLQSPDAEGVTRTNDGVSQLEGSAATFWTWRRQNRLFTVASGGTSFDGRPISQFLLGYPFRLDAFSLGERRGDHYAVLTLGFLHQVARLPDFLGGPFYVGTWLQNGSAFNTDEDADINSHAAFGVVADTLLGPVVAGASVGFDGGWRTFVGIGRVLR
ncbi:MAG TPA: patatin-like phospholipase family protein [Vicinamibacterales bacterium]|nr:patatin-like phospholipase family protein [Vicinamibacterales bacterium]